VEHESAGNPAAHGKVIAEALEQRGCALRIWPQSALQSRETTVLWERKTGKPVANAIVWQDTRLRERRAFRQGRDKTASVHKLDCH